MKRMERFNFNSVAKKPKVQAEPEVEWGDDIGFEEMDKCISLATQQDSQNSAVNNNISLSTYDNFKPKSSYCSTQAFLPPPTPSTSKHFSFQQKKTILNTSNASVSTVITKNVSAQEYQQKLMQEIKKLEEQNKKLTENYEIKDGEISILRSQLKQAQKTADNEKMQKLQHIESNQQHWNDKYNLAIKEKECVKCELDLKQLEIMNLKDLIRELKSKQANINDSVSQSFKSKRSSTSSLAGSKRNVTSQTDVNHSSINIASELCFPLQRLIPESLFEKHACEENTVVKLKNSFDGANLLRHNATQYENIIHFKLPEINKMVLSAEYFFTELILLMKCSNAELNYSNVIPSVNKIILVTRQLLLSNLQQLRKVEQNLSNEDIREMDTQYLYGENLKTDQSYCIFSGKPWSETELGTELRRCLAVLSSLAMHNLYLVQCLTEKSAIQLSEDSRYPIYSKFFTENYNINVNTEASTSSTNNVINEELPRELKCDILNMILHTTLVIGKIRRSHQFSGLLASILALLTSLLNQELTVDCYSMIHTIFQQIVFARPTTPVLKYISTILRHMSCHQKFTMLLCKNSDTNTFRRSKDCFIFSEDTCTFQILAILLERHKKNINFAYDIMNFLYNILTNNSLWISPQDQRCECLFKIYCIAIELLYELMQESLKNKSCIGTSELEVYHVTFQIGLIVICVLTYRSPDLIIGSLRLYSQYLNWIKKIHEMEHSLKLDSNQIISLETLLLCICNDGPSEETSKLVENDEVHLTQQIQLINIL